MKKKYAHSEMPLLDIAESRAGCLATDRIMVDGCEVGYMYRELTDRPEDSGWRFFAGDESKEYLSDVRNSGVYALNTVANYDLAIVPYLEDSAPCAFERIPGDVRFRRVE